LPLASGKKLLGQPLPPRNATFGPSLSATILAHTPESPSIAIMPMIAGIISMPIVVVAFSFVL